MTDTPKRGPGRPPRAIKRVGVLVRFEPAELAAIDEARGDVTRQDWIARASLAVTAEDRHWKPDEPMSRPLVEPHMRTISDRLTLPKAKPGSRLKGK